MRGTSTFDVNQFLETTYKDKLDTRVEPIPDGWWHAQTTKLDGRTFTGDDGRIFTVVELTWTFIGEGADRLKKEMNLREPGCRQSIFLDLLPGTNQLDTGKNANVQLGRLLEVFGLNKGKPWTMRMLLNQTAWVQTEQQIAKSGQLQGEPVSRVVRVSDRPPLDANTTTKAA